MEATRKENEANNATRVGSKRHLFLSLETKSVESMEDTLGASVTMTLVAQPTKGVETHVPEAEEALSRDSRQTKPMREPKGSQLRSIILTL
jgi:hypothetical protein